ncbi:unnamed protein product [Schistosoma margrebowiei]|uniref:Uncharacterized protein n=1 Tax=Schistosoma margrebowiei TaxID=48269 RepID=A0A3P8A9K8_9TREM|nr:unnamed protein product [Schistosoma margrebowiei]
MHHVRSSRGADIDSGHHLVMANMKLKLKKHWTAGETIMQRFNTVSLQDTIKLNEFKITLNNRFQVLRDRQKEEEITMKDN